MNDKNNTNFDSDVLLDISPIRSAIAKAMTKSKEEIPSTVLTFYIDVTDLVDYRNQIKNSIFEKYNIKLSYLPFIVKATIYAIMEYPIFNSLYDKELNKIRIKRYINFGIAVDTPKGLVVPNIKNAEQLSIIDLSKQIIELANKARDNKLSLNDIKDGTISLTNFGSINASWGMPIVNFPEVAILAPGIIEERLVRNKDNQIIVKHMLPFTIAADHRWIDGADIGRFMKIIKKHLETLEDLQI